MTTPHLHQHVELTKTRRHILEACQLYHGAPEGKWTHSLDQKAIDFLVKQELLERRHGDGKTAFIWRLFITDRGRAALRGDMLTKI